MMTYPVAIKSWGTANEYRYSHNENIDYNNLLKKCKLTCRTVSVWNEEEEEKWYSKQFDNEWFNFVKIYILLLQKRIVYKNIISLILPLFIIHIISEYSSPLLFPLFLMPSNSLMSIQAQKKKFILNNVIKKFEIIICNRYSQKIKHKLAYYPNSGVFIAGTVNNLYATGNNHIAYTCLKYKTKPIINCDNCSQIKILVHLETQYREEDIRILIKIKDKYEIKEAEFCCEIMNNVFEPCIVALLNVNNYIPMSGEKYGNYKQIFSLHINNK